MSAGERRQDQSCLDIDIWAGQCEGPLPRRLLRMLGLRRGNESSPGADFSA
jgi:hypothetical protein